MIWAARTPVARNEAGGSAAAAPAAGAETPDDEPLVSESDPDEVIIDEAKLILAEKRTSMALMRTGIAVFALPLSVLSLLIATSRYYDVVHVVVSDHSSGGGQCGPAGAGHAPGDACPASAAPL